MKKFADFIVRKKYLLLGIFFALIVLSAVAMNFVRVNYDLTKYLPDSSSTKSSLAMMKEEFKSSGTASVMVVDVTQKQSREIESNLNKIAGIASANITNSKESEVKAAKAENQKYYMLYNIFLTTSDYDKQTETTLKSIETTLNGYTYYCTGASVDAITSRNAVSNEIPIILGIAVLIVIAILLFTTRSWIEPVILLLVIGIAILINMGTNIIMGEISYVTKSISSVLLIALAMDYSIVLVSRFREEREKEPDIHEAMKKALAGSMVTIIASACTVMAGLIALIFMDYKIGADMGIVLTKGVFISVLAVIFLMPAILLLFSKLLAKTEHKQFIGSVKGIGTFAHKSRWIMPFVFIAVIACAGAVQFTQLKYTYVPQAGYSTSKVMQDKKAVQDVFGVQNPLVIMFDKNLTIENEEKIVNDLRNRKIGDTTQKLGDLFTMTNSFATIGGKYIVEGEEDLPLTLGLHCDEDFMYLLTHMVEDEEHAPTFLTSYESFLHEVDKYGPKTCKDLEYKDTAYLFAIIQCVADTTNYPSSIYTNIGDFRNNFPATTELMVTLNVAVDKAYKMFYGETKERMIFNLNATIDSQLAIDAVNEINKYLKETGYEYNIVNNTQNVIETESVFEVDKLKVELIAIGAIIVIVLISFRRISVPVILAVVIQGALWINLGVNALMGNSIFFICYLLGTAIQMGATIDYGILLCDRYVEARRKQDKKEAIKTAVDKSFTTIISSGAILVLAALTIGLISSVPMISSIGYLIAMGAGCALVSMLFVLPQCLLLFDKLIIKNKKNKLENKDNVIEVKDSEMKY